MADVQDEQPRVPFVSRLREEVASAQVFELQPSVATCHTPRGTHRLGARPGEHRSSQRGSVRFAQEEEAAPKIDLRFKGGVAKPFKLEGVEVSILVRDLKALCQRYCLLEPEQQRLLHKGKILQDDQRLEETGVKSGATLFLVRGASASSGPQDDRDRISEQERERQLPQIEAGMRMVGPPCSDCGVNPGRLQTDGLCSICFREQVVKENRRLKKKREDAKRREEEAVLRDEERRREEAEMEIRNQQDSTRCYSCRRKIGLTGFQCQCGFHFCSTHRHAEDHECTFDHKARGREILAMQMDTGDGTTG